jgi:hypothetical protein
MSLADYRRVDPREVKEIMSQGAIRPETSRDREERRVLDADLATSPLKGEPLLLRPRHFRPDPEATLRAMSGPPRFMRRLREIEDGIEWHEVFLEDAWRTLARDVQDANEFARRWEDTTGTWRFARIIAKEAADPDEFVRRWKETAETWRFNRINKLIDQHNRNFPIEARLPMDPRTRDFVRINGRPYQRRRLDAEWALERFPADRGAVPSA